ncbi:MAG: hypothetical protein M3R36_10770 [Bacteroidota bacterium]|nr:hypothetical protein [Bacteroidota bacterium]
MPKIIAYSLKLFLLLVISNNCFSQTETFDIVTYTPPKDFKKDSKQNVVSYSSVNASMGSFCVIAIYASTASSGDVKKDFEKAWKELVATPYMAEPNPKTETPPNPDGWEIVVGGAPVTLEGIDCSIILMVISGFGKTLSIRTSMTDQSYFAQVNALFETMELDKTNTSTLNNNNTPSIQTNAGTGKFGTMSYTTPAGWSEQQIEGGVVFQPLDLPLDEYLVMQIMQPLHFSGNLEQAMAQSYDEAAAMYKVSKMYQADGNYGKNAPQKSFNGWEYIRGKGGVKAQNGSEFGLELFVIKINNRFERIAILESRKNCNLSRYYTSDRRSYLNSIQNFLFSLKFTDFNSEGLNIGSAHGVDIIGLWQGTIQWTGASDGLHLEVFSPIFLTNGQVYFGSKFPTEGLDDLDTRIKAELNNRDWGTYSFSNGSGVIQMPFGNIPIRTEDEKLIISKDQMDWPFFKLNSVDEARFNGTYVMSEDNGKIPSITFTSEGRFTDDGAIKVLYHEYIDCINPVLTPGSGTYEVKNYSIVFNYNDGRKIKIAFLGAEYDKNNPSPSTLRMSFNEDPMTRQ